MNEITIGDKVYISAKRAAEITGYARDYVGQLCREGHIDAKMVGRSWYVFEASIRAHRFGPESVPVASAQIASVEEPAEVEATPESETDTPTYTSEEPTPLPELTPASLEELLPPAEETLTDMQSAWREWFDQKQKVLEVPEIESPEVIDARNEAVEDEDEIEEAHVDEEEEGVEEEDDSFSVPLQRIEEEEEEIEENTVAIHHLEPVPLPTYTPAPAPQMDMRREVAPVRAAMPVRMEYWDEFAPSEPAQGRVIQERVIAKGTGSARKGSKAAHRTNAPIIAVLLVISLLSVTVALIGTGYAGRYLNTLPSENNPVINFLVGSQKINR